MGRAIGSLILLIFTLPAFADFTLHVGPASSGGGGPNPVSIPPIQVIDYEFIWVTEEKREWSLSIVPGLFYGQRFMLSEGAYVSLGGGLVIDLNGVGPGLYSAFGYDACGSSLCFNVEFRKALGANFRHLMSPYALRVGVTWRTG
ncbi:MAG: hypothetical protein HYW48_06935 [Deltaproteobacteria bacterium]|nr:hypothetical protein [Deltaproteobacteria bacterium]